MAKIIPIIPENNCSQEKSTREPTVFSIWMKLLRLHTLPLSVASVGLGNILAYQFGLFSGVIAVLSLLTAVLLQILGNLANHYGDATHHADDHRPERIIINQKVSLKQIKIAMFIISVLCIFSGCLLIATAGVAPYVFVLLGALSIIAAITYTVGKKPYGYYGLGDFSVWIFFGLVSVLGTFYLQTGTLNKITWLPAMAMGLWCVAVLNINNMRDLKNDALIGKKTVAVYLGLYRAKIYHEILLISALFCWVIYAFTFAHYHAIFWATVFTFLNKFTLDKSVLSPSLWQISLKYMVWTTLLNTITLLL